MNSKQFCSRLAQWQKSARRVLLQTGDVGQKLVTKIGGAPWWPTGIRRPVCEHGHLMEFVVQIRLADLPEQPGDRGLLSFHYCNQCSLDGKMSFGFNDYFNNRGYEVRVIERPEDEVPDGLGAVTPGTLPPSSVAFSNYLEVPSADDMPSDLSQGAALPENYYNSGEENDYRGLIHRRAEKLGGWPSWPQSATWPEQQGRRMSFVVQIDAMLGRHTAWGGGGCAMVFISNSSSLPRTGELCIQTT